MAKKKTTTTKKSKIEQSKDFFKELAKLPKSEKEMLEIGKAAAQAKKTIGLAQYSNELETVLENQKEVDDFQFDLLLEGFIHDKSAETLRVKVPSTDENHRTVLFWASLLYQCDIDPQHYSNHSDYFMKNVFYETMAGSIEFIIENKDNKIVLTATKF